MLLLLLLSILPYLTTVKEADDAVGLAGLLLVVSHHHYRASILLVEGVEYVHHFGSHARIKVAGRFVGQDYVGIAHYGAGNRHALALAAGELCRHMAHAMGKSHPIQNLTHALTTL